MKILIATGIFPPEIGGPATYAAFLYNELKARGDTVDVLPFRDVRGYPKLIRHIVYSFKVLVHGYSADIIFTQDPVSTGIPVIVAAFFLKAKVVMRVAGDYAWEQAVQRYGVTDTIDQFQTKKYNAPVERLRWLQRCAVKYSEVVITPSLYFSKLVSGWLGGAREIVTIYNGIDLAVEYKKEDKFKEKTIITAGRMVPWKGFDTLIKVLKEMPEWRLLIAGDGPDKKRLVDLAYELKVTDRVQFLGQMQRADLFAQIHRAHVCALLTTFESFSFQIVEAMHIGTPVIAANIGNLGEIIESGQNGILIEPTDSVAFKSFAERCVNDQAFAEGISTNARVRAADFSIGATMDQLYGVFNQVKSKK
jgi:glycosyltransferase involved in cell wall biosynthesis